LLDSLLGLEKFDVLCLDMVPKLINIGEAFECLSFQLARPGLESYVEEVCLVLEFLNHFLLLQLRFVLELL